MRLIVRVKALRLVGLKHRQVLQLLAAAEFVHGHHVFADTIAAAQAQEELSYRFKLDLGKRLEADLGTGS
jgi:hypothetical protein